MPGRFGHDSTAAEVVADLDLGGRTMLVTGANAGIGLETVRALVGRGARVYALARDAAKAESVHAVAEDPDAVIPLVCDLGDLASVAVCADAILAAGRPLDALVANAGVYYLPELGLVHGIEEQFFVNHLGHFLLIRRLLPLVEAAAGRVVVVGSEAHYTAEGIDYAAVEGALPYDSKASYAQSKLANGLFALELARRLDGSRATSNVLSPMWVLTDAMRVHLRREGIGDDVAAAAKTPAQGAATNCYVAADPGLEGVSGRYFQNCAEVEPSPAMRDEAAAARLWDYSERLVARILPGDAPS